MKSIKNCHPKVVETVKRMLIDIRYKMPFYGEFNLMVNFKEEKTIPTCGVNVTRRGMNFYYNSQFLDSLGTKDGEIQGRTEEEKKENEWERQKQINFIVLHEDFHLLFNHPKRTVSGRYDPYLANIAQDMIINSIIWEDINHNFVSIPKYPDTEDYRKVQAAGQNMALFLPKEYDGPEIFEVLYEWLKEKKDEYQKRRQQMGGNQNQCQTCNGSGKKQDGDKGEGDEQDGNGGKGNQNPGNQGQQNQNGGGGNQQQEQNQDGNGDGDGGNGNQEQEQDGDGNGNNDDHNHSDKGEPCPDCGGKGSNGKDLSGNPEYGPYGKSGDQEVDTYSLDSLFENMEKTQGQYMDSHIGDEIPEALRDTIMKDVVERLRARGFTSQSIEATLGKLRKKKKDYLREIKRTISNQILGTRKIKTIVRPNRRGIKGLKGFRKVKTKINVLLDVSGSMGGMFEKVLSYVFQNDIEINLIQVDTEIHSAENIKSKKELQMVQIVGLGGTILQPGVDLVCEKYNKYNTVMLTDGYCDDINFSKHAGKVLIISTGDPVVVTSKPKKGYKQIIVDDSYD